MGDAELEALAQRLAEEHGSVRRPLEVALATQHTELSPPEAARVLSMAMSRPWQRRANMAAAREVQDRDAESQMEALRPGSTGGRAHRLPDEDRAKLRTDIRALLAEDPTVGAAEAHRRIGQAVSLPTFCSVYFNPIRDELGIPTGAGRRGGQNAHAARRREPAAVAPPALPAAAPIQPVPLSLKPGAVADAQTLRRAADVLPPVTAGPSEEECSLLRSRHGRYEANPRADGTFDLVLVIRGVKRSAHVQLQGMAHALLFPTP